MASNRLGTALPLIDHKCIVVAILRPWPMRDFLEIYKTPVGHVSVAKLEKIAHGWRYIETGALVQIWFGPLVPENILPMIGTKRPSIFPLRVSDAIAFANRHPTPLARANRRTLISVLEPWNNLGCFWPMTARNLVVVRQRTIKRILPRGEIRRNIASAVSTIRIIEPAVAVGPIFVPRT